MRIYAMALAALAAGPCESAAGPEGQVVMGTWGGDNAGLIADDTSAHVHIRCTFGNVHQAIKLDAAGRFDVSTRSSRAPPPPSRRAVTTPRASLQTTTGCRASKTGNAAAVASVRSADTALRSRAIRRDRTSEKAKSCAPFSTSFSSCWISMSGC